MQALQIVTGEAITLERRGRWRTLAGPVFFIWGGIVYQVPAGFRWNGASIPFFLWWWVSPWSAWVVLASCVHDWLYTTRTLSRRDADRILYLLLADSARRSLWRWQRYQRLVRARIIYQAVREWGDDYIGADW